MTSVFLPLLQLISFIEDVEDNVGMSAQSCSIV